MGLKVGTRVVFTVTTIFGMLLMALPVTPVFAAEGDAITIDADYTLMSDMTFNGTGFIINADNITIDLNGHTITGNYPPYSKPPYSGVEAINHSGVTIKNGTIRGFNVGIFLLGSNNNVISGIVTSENTYLGILVSASDGNLISNVTAVSNIQEGLRVASSQNNTITNTTSSNNGWHGLQISGGLDYSSSGGPDYSSSNTSVLDSKFINNGSIGLPANGISSSDANNTVIENCILAGNAGWGVAIKGFMTPEFVYLPSYNHLIKESIIKDNINNSPGYPIPIGGGIYFEYVEESLVVGNSTIKNSPEGMKLVYSSGNSIINNNIALNSGPGLVITTGSNHNEILDNSIDNNGANGIRLGAGPADKTFMTGPAPNNNNISNNTVEGNAANGMVLVTGASDNTIANNTIKENGTNGILVPEPPPGVPPPAQPTNNTISGNKFINNPNWDIQDTTTGDGTVGTANIYSDNKGKTSSPEGLVK